MNSSIFCREHQYCVLIALPLVTLVTSVRDHSQDSLGTNWYNPCVSAVEDGSKNTITTRTVQNVLFVFVPYIVLHRISLHTAGCIIRATDTP